MYNLITFMLIILIPTFLGLLITTNVKENAKPIIGVGIIIALIIGYMYIPGKLPLSKKVLENALLYYENGNNDKFYQKNFLLIPRDRQIFIELLNQQKFYPLMDDLQYFYGNSHQFELFDTNYMDYCRLNINADTYSTLSKGKKYYRFQASSELLELADRLSRAYGPTAYDNTQIDSLNTQISLKESKDYTYFFDLTLKAEDTETLVIEINLYYEYNKNEFSLTYLLDESPITNFKDTIEVSMIKGKDAYLKEAKDCQLIIRGQHIVEGEIVPFQKLIDIDELISE